MNTNTNRQTTERHVEIAKILKNGIGLPDKAVDLTMEYLIRLEAEEIKKHAMNPSPSFIENQEEPSQ